MIKREAAVAYHEQIRLAVIVIVSGNGANRRATELCRQSARLIGNLSEFSSDAAEQMLCGSS